MTIADGFLLGVGLCLAVLAIRLIGVGGVLLVLGIGYALATWPIESGRLSS
jgi:hypothetical protein